MNNNDLLDPQSVIHQAAYETVSRLWPIIIQLVRVRPELANSMRAALPPALPPPQPPAPLASVPAPAAMDSRIDRILKLIKKLGLTLPEFLKLLFSLAPDGRTRGHMQTTMVSKLLGGMTATPIDEIISMIFEHRDSAPKATRGDSKAALRKKSVTHMARGRLLAWASRIVRDELKREMGVLVDPKTSVLRPRKGFSWTDLNRTSMDYFSRTIRSSAPVLQRTLLAVATTTRKEKELENGSAAAAAEGRGRSKRDPRLVSRH